MGDSMLEIAKRVDQFFMEQSPVHDTMRRLSLALRDIGIPFAIAGAMAANAHGHKRTTGNVDILLHPEGFNAFKERWTGLDGCDLFEGSKGFRDTLNNVKVNVLLTGQYPGDGLPKPVMFPPPESVSEMSADGLSYINLATLLELKLASGMTADHRPRDLDDVIQLIRANRLPQEYAERLNPYVRERFRELWGAAQIEEDY
jgi:hypothetical protein